MKYIFTLFLMMGLSGAIVAQERTASGAMDTQVTWTALSTLAKAASDKADMVDARVDQSVVCGRKGMIYAPGATGVDSDGCLNAATNPATQTTINSILNCNASGQVYSQTARTCINAATTAARCNIHMTGGHRTAGGRSGSAATCPSGYAPVMTGALGSTGCNTDHGSCADPQYYLCYRTVCQ